MHPITHILIQHMNHIQVWSRSVHSGLAIKTKLLQKQGSGNSLLKLSINTVETCTGIQIGHTQKQKYDKTSNYIGHSKMTLQYRHIVLKGKIILYQYYPNGRH